MYMQVKVDGTAGNINYIVPNVQMSDNEVNNTDTGFLFNRDPVL